MVPFPNYEPDTDVAMFDSPSSASELDPFFLEKPHTRLHSTASSTSGSSGYSDGIDYNSRMYNWNSNITQSDTDIRIALYPRLTVVDYQPADPAKAVGLLQPASSFTHHG